MSVCKTFECEQKEILTLLFLNFKLTNLYESIQEKITSGFACPG